MGYKLGSNSGRAIFIKDDKYYYNSEEVSLIGKKNKNKYQLGDRIAVEVKKADLVKKHLDFTII